MARIFISYRRQQTMVHATWIHDRLAERFGAEAIFRDADSIEPGEIFEEVIRAKLESCDVMLVLIGPQWLDCRDADDRRRIDQSDDLVRIEVATAIARGIRVIPVLLGDTPMPRFNELPSDLSELANRDAAVVSDKGFRDDVARLVAAVDRALNAAEGTNRVRTRVDEAQGATLGRLGVQLGEMRKVIDQKMIFECVAFSPDSRLLGAAGSASYLSDDCAIVVWSVDDDEIVARLDGHTGPVRCVSYSPDQSFLVSACDEALMVWSMAEYRCLMRCENAGSRFAIARDGRTLISWAGEPAELHSPSLLSERYCKLWSIPDGSLRGYGALHELVDWTEFLWDCVSNSASLVARAVSDVRDDELGEYVPLRVIALDDTATGTLVRNIQLQDAGIVTSIAFSGDGTLIAAGSVYESQIRLIEVSSTELLASVDLPAFSPGLNGTPSLALSPDGRWLAAVCHCDGGARLWSLRG